jgi:hypothetical protein
MPAESGGPWPPMLWIGGTQGAGKSRLSWTLAHAQDLPLHPVGLWSCDHVARLPAEGFTLDDQLAFGPQAAADAFVATSRARPDLVLADVAGPLPRGWAVWLIPEPAPPGH